MPESFLGDGLIFEESLPVVWTPGALAEGVQLARLNADNHQLLGAESSLDEVRVHEALKDESPALLQQIAQLNDRSIGLLEHQRRAKGRDLDMAAVGRRAVAAYSGSRQQR